MPALQQIDVEPPAYQTEGRSFKLDLSCLVDDKDRRRAAVDSVRAINVNTGDWPTADLQRVTTLDRSQLQALKVGLP